ncbi:MAG: hypothetical protein M1368_06055 [Thaumarchaeota archaeon]|nr:hypothetical protein [Nitrososphaerota archaeon]
MDKKLGEVSGMKKAAKLVAVQFKCGVMQVGVSEKSFVGSMPRFAYRDEEHEAKFLFRRIES